MAHGGVRAGTTVAVVSVMPISGYREAFASLRDPERAVKIFLDPAER